MIHPPLREQRRRPCLATGIYPTNAWKKEETDCEREQVMAAVTGDKKRGRRLVEASSGDSELTPRQHAVAVGLAAWRALVDQNA